MNKYQRLVVIVAVIDVLVMLLFPPFNDRSLARGMPESFDGFYPVMSALGERPVNSALLSLQLFFVTINGLAAWLVLQTKKHHEDLPVFAYAQGIAWFITVNLAIVFLFPPFEPYQSLQRNAGPTFDSFYFVFGDRSKRPIYEPLLHLEVIFIVVNAMALWLLFNAVKRNDDAAREKILHLAEALPDEQLQKLTAEIQHRIEEHQQSHNADPSPGLGRGTDRRHHTDPAYRGPERRSGVDRRDQH